MKRLSRTTRWIVAGLTSVAVVAAASIGVVVSDPSSAAAGGDQVCHKVENPSGTITINRDGLVMSLEIGTYPDAKDPNRNNAVVGVTVDPSSAVTSGQIIVKGGPSSNTYPFGAATPLHAPGVGHQQKWPTISYVQVCWQKPPVAQYGRVEVTKAVVGEGAPSDQVFEISLTPEGGSPIVKSITGAGVVVFEALEPGVYALAENDPGSDWKVAYSDTSITVVAGETATATVTNTYDPPVVPQLGRVEVTKAIEGEGAPTDEVFEISLVPENGSPITKNVTGAGAITFDGLEPGVYSIVESDPGDNWIVSYSSPTVTVVGAETTAVTVTNTWSPPAPELGRVEVTKAVVGEDAPDDAVFEISLTPEGGSPIVKSITGAGVLAFEDLEPGVYALSEKNPGSGWTVSYSSPTITVVAGDTALATVTNTYAGQVAPPELGSVVVTKVVHGNPPPATFQIGLIGPAPATTERWLTITGSGELTFSALPVGIYTVVERNPGEGYTVAISPADVVVTNGGVARATVTNTYVAQAPPTPPTTPTTTPPSSVAPSAGTQTTVAQAAGELPKTGSNNGQMAVIALVLVAGGSALMALTRRRVI